MDVPSICARRQIGNRNCNILNERGVETDVGRPWTRGTVHQILINEKYIGNNVWNRGSLKLKKLRVHNDPSMWIRAEGVFDPIVDSSLFETAQAIIAKRSIKLSDQEMLDALRQLFDDRGYLSGIIIDESEPLPSSSAYQSRFGSQAIQHPVDMSIARAHKLGKGDE
jgi:Recombinase